MRKSKYIGPGQEGFMRKSKYSEEQIIGALKRAEQGIPLKDICQDLGISNVTG